MSLWRSGYRQKKIPSTCKCDHEKITHYTKDGHCVYPGCGCSEFKPKGRPEFQSKRSTCQYQHSHDSGLEVKACFDLHCQKIAGDIKDFRFHEILDLQGPSGRNLFTYEIDFTVEHHDGSIEYIETKGDHLSREMGWRMKWKLLQDKHDGDPKYKFRVIRG